jgi:hypothetical protein
MVGPVDSALVVSPGPAVVGGGVVVGSDTLVGWLSVPGALVGPPPSLSLSACVPPSVGSTNNGLRSRQPPNRTSDRVKNRRTMAAMIPAAAPGGRAADSAGTRGGEPC